MHEIKQTPPEKMSAEQRRREVASLLANVRQLMQASSCLHVVLGLALLPTSAFIQTTSTTVKRSLNEPPKTHPCHAA